MKLFDHGLPKDDSPLEPVNIVQTSLYYNEAELREFKRKAKAIMKYRYGVEAKNNNFSDLILKLIRETYDKIDRKKTLNGREGHKAQGQIFG